MLAGRFCRSKDYPGWILDSIQPAAVPLGVSGRMPRKANDLIVEDEPLTKRQRKAPVWASTYERDKLAADDEDQRDQGKDEVALGSPSAPSTAGPEELAPTATVVEHSFPNPDQLEVVMVLEDGTSCRGVLSRATLPHGVGIPTQATKEELEAVSAAPPHGQNPNNLCGLCNLPLATNPAPGISDALTGTYLRAQISSNWVARVHLKCAVWSPEVVEDEDFPNHFDNMRKAVRRGRMLRCKACKQRGATVGCFDSGCQCVYHLPCAAEVGCRLEEDGHVVWCPMHSKRSSS